MHAALPLAALYFPVAQAVHAPPFAPLYPGRHAHCDTSCAPSATVDDFAGQKFDWPFVHHSGPVQMRHALVPSPTGVYPCRHLQSDGAVDAGNETVEFAHRAATPPFPSQ